MGYLLGIDVGTTNTKAVLYDPAIGKAIAVASRSTETYHPRPGRSESQPAELWQGVVEAIREVTAGRAGDVRAVAASSFAEAGVPVDRDGQYLYPLIAWYDPRSEPQSRYWWDWLGRERVFEITGQPIQFKYTASKLLWFKEHEPQVFASIYKWLCAEDFALWNLSGRFVTDYSIASRTMAFDQRSLDWSPEILERIGVGAEIFPRAFQAGTVVGEVTAAAAAETGLIAGTPVVTGGHDHLCGAYAVGTLGPGQLLNSLGTAEAALLVVNGFNPDARLAEKGYSHYAYILPQTYVLHFGLTASGGMLEWLVHQLAPEAEESVEGRRRAFGALMAAAEAVPPGSEGLFWLPHINGVGTPWLDERSRACAVGLTQGHGRGHMVRALLESLSYWMRENMDALVTVVDVPRDRPITAIGGGSRNALWMQIKADVTGRPVQVVDVPEAVATGAALLAGVGVGAFPGYAEAAATVAKTATLYEPDAARHAVYSRYFEQIYSQIYPAVAELNHRIHGLFAGGA
ncbi:MAG: FGGY-family carbohydrate kinase [Chloroflexota bacterium]